MTRRRHEDRSARRVFIDATSGDLKEVTAALSSDVQLE
jgi:hypothetical protein